MNKLNLVRNDPPIIGQQSALHDILLLLTLIDGWNDNCNYYGSEEKSGPIFAEKKYIL